MHPSNFMLIFAYHITLQTVVHYSLHFIFPALLAWLFFRSYWQKAYLIMLLTMLMDLDHLLANPVFDPNRCSINFHPLHTTPAMVVYIALLFFKPTQAIGVGLLFHILTDGLDCLWMRGYII
ncbi:MAG: hypothetical protein RLZZ292_915 [Bacteroidota bacterium]|jgi:hypothetical protein